MSGSVIIIRKGFNASSSEKNSIQGLPELADQNNTVNSPSFGNNRKNVQKNLS
jgi:hypothetical protein